MKAILISIRPQWVAKILNGEKTIEIRKKFPEDYVGWVYIYCTKNGGNFAYDKGNLALGFDDGNKFWEQYRVNGKVVARFWCNKVEPIAQYDGYEERYFTKSLWETELFEKSCLDLEEMRNYIHNHCGYAIHITKLEIFDSPTELKNFLVYSHTVDGIGFKGEPKSFQILKPLIKAPQSWRYIEE